MSDIVVLRRRHKRHFTTLDNDLIRDSRLSWKATGLLVYLLSLSETYKLHISRLSKQKLDGRDSTMSAIHELQRAGYVTIEQSRGCEGRYGTTVWTIDDSACSRAGSSDFPPSTENPFTAEPRTVEPEPETPSLRNTNTERTSQRTTSSTDASNLDVEIAYPRSLTNDERDAVWSVVHDLHPRDAQAVVDELAGAMAIPGRIAGSPIEYANGIARKARAGEFVPRLAVRVARDRAAAAEREAAKRNDQHKRGEQRAPTEQTRELLKKTAALLHISAPGITAD
ncbi:hypothetical protein [Dyella sp. EPa41]|uniref:hypothetical protein n=1 Tax=Dyella sp. EPa41 TaxID=1561194 RepID=UPI001914EECB|nr:hypothetical protein [Dyella sp. EPa41]